MSRDNWARLVEATLKREELRQLAFCQSFSTCSSIDDSSSRFSLDSTEFEADRISNGTIISEASSSQSIPSRRIYTIKFEEINKATKNFHPYLFLGEGRFGPVYKGWIHEYNMTAAKPGFGLTVAIKKWKLESFQALKECLNVFRVLSKLEHPNLGKLIAHCSEEDNQIFVYEFMPKGSLDSHLFKRGYQSLSWATRMKVAIGASRALSFLHSMDIQVIYRDLTPGNILLDEEYNAKLYNFSLAVDGPIGDMAYVTTQFMGTRGYAAPEYVATGRLTTKCDVYSFGVCLLELLAGRRVIDFSRAPQEENLVTWAQPYLQQKRKLKKVMDTKLEGQYPKKGANIVANLARKNGEQESILLQKRNEELERELKNSLEREETMKQELIKALKQQRELGEANAYAVDQVRIQSHRNLTMELVNLCGCFLQILCCIFSV